MPPKGKPEERTILQALSELAGYEDIQTSEDLGKLSESEFKKKWVLPLITGAEAETEEYQPGAIDLTFAAIPFVGGGIKTGFKLAKPFVKRSIAKLSQAYKGSVRPKVLPQKDELLRGASEGYQPGTYAQQVEEAIPTQPITQAARTSEQSIQRIISQTQGMIRGGVGGGNLTYSQARSIYDDIGLEVGTGPGFSKKFITLKKLFLILFPLRIYPYDGLGSVGLIPNTYKKFLSNVLKFLEKKDLNFFSSTR